MSALVCVVLAEKKYTFNQILTPSSTISSIPSPPSQQPPKAPESKAAKAAKAMAGGKGKKKVSPRISTRSHAKTPRSTGVVSPSFPAPLYALKQKKETRYFSLCDFSGCTPTHHHLTHSSADPISPPRRRLFSMRAEVVQGKGEGEGQQPGPLRAGEKSTRDASMSTSTRAGGG